MVSTALELKREFDQNIGCCRITTGRGRILPGTRVVQDWKAYIWPDCAPPAADPDMIFDVYWTGGYWVCKACGYGWAPYRALDAYGNGYLLISEFNAITLETE